jgi:hypothetical protein
LERPGICSYRTVLDDKATVKANEGAVTFTGTATTGAEKELVGLDATDVDGVKTVKNEILFMAPHDSGGGRPGFRGARLHAGHGLVEWRETPASVALNGRHRLRSAPQIHAIPCLPQGQKQQSR